LPEKQEKMRKKKKKIQEKKIQENFFSLFQKKKK